MWSCEHAALLLLIVHVTLCTDTELRCERARSPCAKGWWELRHLSAVMNSKHLHYSRKAERLRDGDEGREESKCSALKLATRDLTCYKAWSNKKQPPCKPPLLPPWELGSTLAIMRTDGRNTRSYTHTYTQTNTLQLNPLYLRCLSC